MLIEFKEKVENLFKNNDKFSDSDGVLFIPQILEAIEKIDSDLIKILINDASVKSHFFTQIEDVYVLNQNKLIEFFMMNDYMKNGSYTSYTNKIGLIKKDSFIKKFDDVVLAWPHKDCVLEGGATKDDDKSKETFYNEILSHDEIDRLFEPKVLTNINKFYVIANEVKQSTPTEINDNDNLIIKGNNLVALHSLKKKFAGKVKLIYIDPPYNRKRLKSNKTDSFGYNDNFNHSTWLTFMKNRLEAAKDFLSDDGVVFVSIDNAEYSYLQVLCEEIFGSNNFVSSIIWEKGKEGGNDSSFIGIHHDFILFLTKDSNKFKINLDDKDISRHKIHLPEDNFACEPTEDCMYKNGELFQLINLSKQKDYKLKIPLKNGSFLEWEGYMPQNTLDEYILGGRIFVNSQRVPYVKSFLSDEIDGSKPSTLFRGKGMTTKAGTIENKTLFGKKTFEYPKPEALLKRIIELTTQPSDLVMDYHLGSGTTCAVAHKMGRRYIGIEQMDYIEDIAVERMKKVLEGEQGGISKAVNWNGGGSFIYAELKTIDNFKDAEVGKLNKNMQYLPISEIEDEDYGVTAEEIAINKAFYGLG